MYISTVYPPDRLGHLKWHMAICIHIYIQILLGYVDAMRHDTTRYNKIQHDTIRYNAIQWLG